MVSKSKFPVNFFLHGHNSAEWVLYHFIFDSISFSWLNKIRNSGKFSFFLIYPKLSMPRTHSRHSNHELWNGIRWKYLCWAEVQVAYNKLTNNGNHVLLKLVIIYLISTVHSEKYFSFHWRFLVHHLLFSKLFTSLM